MKEVILVIVLLFADGSTSSSRVPTTGWDDCYVKATNEIDKYQQDPNVQAMSVECDARVVKP